jgi:hypothetical protein
MFGLAQIDEIPKRLLTIEELEQLSFGSQFGSQMRWQNGTIQPECRHIKFPRLMLRFSSLLNL